MALAVGSDDLRQITDEIFTAVVGLSLEPTASDERHAGGQRVHTGLVQITGAWTGAVTVEVSDGLAVRAAATMFGTAPEETSADDVRDTVGEIANMVGGNVKSMLGGVNQLSLPSVTEGVDYTIAIPGSAERERVALRHDDDLLVVRVLEQETDRAGQDRWTTTWEDDA